MRRTIANRVPSERLWNNATAASRFGIAALDEALVAQQSALIVMPR
ncbi:hypothetical protein YT1_0273 [Rhodococcus ruber]|nr:hypothetical protein YT1_0273 [Rhodococcus ruber]CCW13908.1 hypothetical protein EBESD8_44720 [Rhodococcus aetherivorans]